MPKVSVIVPNFRHAPYLRWRIDTILGQTFRDFELLILDDDSPDESRSIIEQYRQHENVRILYNDKNSGSVFRQWEKGIRATNSEYVWIAESDDWAAPTFLERLVPILDHNSKVGLAYTQSWLVNRDSKVTGNAECWTNNLDADRWKRDFIADGREEICRYLLARNTIPNASAVLMRRNVLEKVMPLETDFRLCGDWLHWIKMLAEADLAFVADNLNFWRLESSNARTQLPGIVEWEEGERILTWGCNRLNFTAAQKDKVLLTFLRQCWQWLRDANDGSNKNMASNSENVSVSPESSTLAARDAETLRNKLRTASDSELLDFYVDNRSKDPTLVPFLPNLPTNDIQARFTGLSNFDAFRQAFAFLRILRNFANERNSPFGGDDQRVLDFGCGWGRITQSLLPFFQSGSIHAVDVMPSALDICKDSGLQVNLEPVFPWPPSPFPDANFDYIVSYSVFSHLSEDNSFAWIREFSRILKPGGIAAITTRYRDFVSYPKQLRDQPAQPAFSRGAARSFIDTDAVLAAYDRGEFCFDGEGKGGPGLTQTYGETLIPKQYAETKYSPFFRVVAFIPPNYTERLDQAVILLMK